MWGHILWQKAIVLLFYLPYNAHYQILVVQVYKGGLFKTATEHKEQIRYFSQQVYAWLGGHSKSNILYI